MSIASPMPYGCPFILGSKGCVIGSQWRLIQAPAAAMGALVAHEVCHLSHRHHVWRERKQLLEAWERDVFHGRMRVG